MRAVVAHPRVLGMSVLPHRPLGGAVAACAAVALAGTGLGATTKIALIGHESTLRSVSVSGGVPIAGAAGRMGVVRSRYVLPRTWRRVSGLDAATIRFDTKNSCGHKVTLVTRLVVGADVPAAERAAAMTAVDSPRSVRAVGTRESAAFRVVSPPRSKGLIGVLVQPLPHRPGDPTGNGQRLFAEVRATATADPRRECHAGGPRSVGAALGDAFGAGSAGGFVLR